MKFLTGLVAAAVLSAGAAQGGTLTIVASENAAGDIVFTGTGDIDVSSYSRSSARLNRRNAFGDYVAGTNVGSLLYAFSDVLVYTYEVGIPNGLLQPISISQTLVSNNSATQTVGDGFGIGVVDDSVFLLLPRETPTETSISFATTYAGRSLETLPPNFGTIFDDGINHRQ